MNKLKKLLAVTAAVLICSGTMAYMPQDSSTNANTNTAYATEESVAIDATNFPDAIFRQYVAENFDKDEDEVLSAEEILKSTDVNVSWLGISDMAGIEYLTELKTLQCGFNQLYSLDISKNIKLTHLLCDGNKLTSLDISKNIMLTELYCCNNQITSLDTSYNPELVCIWCEDNQLKNINVSKNILLKILRCYNNQLTTIDLSNNTSLEHLYCQKNNITSLDISKNTKLNSFLCRDNHLTSLDVSKNKALITLQYDNNTFIINLKNSTFDLSTLPAGFDVTKAAEWTNGTVNGNILTVEDDTKAVTYTYDCGNEKTATFTLIPTDKPTLPLGDINGDNTVDASDASNVLAVYALVSTGKESGLTEAQIAAADVNKDGTIDASDASLILAYYAYIQTGGTGTLEEYLNS